MVTVLNEAGFAVRIYTDDHAPAHVHVIKDGKTAKINLMTLALIQHTGMKANDLRRAQVLIAENRRDLLIAWSKIHG